MNLKIKLENPKYCNGCFHYEWANTDGDMAPDICHYYNCIVIRGIRPQKCIEENGE